MSPEDFHATDKSRRRYVPFPSSVRCPNIEQKAHPKARKYLPGDVERIIGSKNGFKTKKARGRKNAPRVVAKVDESMDSWLNVHEFPELPEFNLSILERFGRRGDMG